MTTLYRRVLAALFAVCVLALTAPATFAHAQLVESDPPDGGSIASPYVLVMRYDEELKPVESTVTVRDGSGTVVAEGGIVDDNFTMIVELPAVPVGSYQAHWIAITADDNGKTQGDVNFTVVAATAPPSVTPQPSVSPTYQPPPSFTPPATASAITTETPTPTPAATPAPGTGGASGTELVVPLILVAALVVALVWFLLRRRPS